MVRSETRRRYRITHEGFAVIEVVEKVKGFVGIACPPLGVSRFLLQLRMIYTTIRVPTQ